MTEPLSPPSADRCRAAADRILASQGWRLLDYAGVGVTRNEFGQRVCRRAAELLAQGSRLPEDQLIQKAVSNQYGVILHDALKMDDTLILTEAYLEIWKRLFPSAVQKVGSEWAEDLTQKALLNIWRAFHSHAQPVRDPSAFLGWSTRVLLNEIGQWYRHREQQAEKVPYSSTEDENDARLAVELPAGSDYDFWNLVRRCLSRPDEFAIILAVFRDDASIKALADQIGRTPNWVSLKKFKALAHLRECRELASWFKEGAE